MVTLMLSSDERLGCCDWGKPALVLVLALAPGLVFTYVTVWQTRLETHAQMKTKLLGQKEGEEKVNFQPDHLPDLSHGCTLVATGKGRGECKIGSSGSSPHLGQHKASVKPLPKPQSVQLSHLAGESEAQFSTAFGLPF